MYCAIIGDIINSKKIRNRNLIQEKIKEILCLVNKRYEDNIASPFAITLGDEFQGLLKDCSVSLEIITLINLKMYPIKIRYGIGVGNITTEINKEACIGSDGPAFWNARQAINYIHENNDYGVSKTFVKIEFADENKEKTINNTLQLCDLYEYKWTNSQYSFLSEAIDYLLDDNFSQKWLSDKLGLSPQLINQKIKGTGILTVIRMKKSIEKMMLKIEEENNG